MKFRDPLHSQTGSDHTDTYSWSGFFDVYKHALCKCPTPLLAYHQQMSHDALHCLSFVLFSTQPLTKEQWVLLFSLSSRWEARSEAPGQAFLQCPLLSQMLKLQCVVFKTSLNVHLYSNIYYLDPEKIWENTLKAVFSTSFQRQKLFCLQFGFFPKLNYVRLDALILITSFPN